MRTDCGARLDLWRNGWGWYGICCLGRGHGGHHRAVVYPVIGVGVFSKGSSWVEWETADT